MANSYNKKDFNKNWIIAKGFFKTLVSNYNVFLKMKEDSLIHPIVDEMFHTQEKIAISLLIVKKGDCIVNHGIIMKKFIEEFESDSRFKEIVKDYPEIFDLKNSMMYIFDKKVDYNKLETYMNTIKKFKEQAEHYLSSVGVKDL